MNIFLPYENSIEKSVQSLDDVRLNKQAVECYQLLTSALKERNGQDTKGHSHHPVYLFYKDNLKFLTYYGYECCREYRYRFLKEYSLIKFFDNQMESLKMFIDDNDGYILGVEIPKFTPYYMEGSKDSPDCIRTTKNVDILFQQKLISKWQNDNRKPKWTNRDIPKFYEEYLDLAPYMQDDFWVYIKTIKKRNYKNNV